MIDRQEIIHLAATLGLTPHIVEKDYVLGWLLWGISNHAQCKDAWLFKGGTCLKKCFFETCRFSEDLDFTLRDPELIEQESLVVLLRQICASVYEATGVEFPQDMLRVEIYTNPRGHAAVEGRIGYRGPVSPRGANAPRIKLDLTADEIVVLPGSLSQVFHPYTDAPQGGISILSYAYEEAFAEKVRALAERTRPRDLYDVVNLFRNEEARPDSSVLLDVLRQKCEFKGIGVPTYDALAEFRVDLEGSWAAMLRHQLPELPPLASFWEELPGFFEWLHGRARPARLAPYAAAPGESVIRDRFPAIQSAPGFGGAL